ncbi:hypothetical protein [Hoeflea sp.]|uniref:hypothetical protein n=1 Tax=Hoeflea sp. TaxID=1940281 RepID=UPI003B01EFE0
MRLIAVVTLTLTLVVPVPAQAFGDRKVHCGNLTEGDVNAAITVICGMSTEQFADNMRLALSPLAADKEELFRRLDDLLPQTAELRVGAIRGFFQILGEREVPPGQLQDRFAEIAVRHQELLLEIRKFRVRDPDVQRLRDEAAAALDADPPDHDAARLLLGEGRELVRKKRQAAAKLLADQQREEAQLVREQAEIEASRLRFADAAALYEEAASLLPRPDINQQYWDLMASAQSWHYEGRDFGDNSALVESIRVLRAGFKSS